MSRKIAFIASILFLQLPFLAVQKSTSSTFPQVASGNFACEIQAENGETGEFSAKQLQTLASRITVRVIGDNNGGSGTLIAKRGNKYLVLTNHHVIRGVNSIQIKMADGKTYNAAITPNTNFDTALCGTNWYSSSSEKNSFGVAELSIKGLLETTVVLLPKYFAVKTSG